MNINKRINGLHRELDKMLDKMLLEDLEQVGDLFFQKYQPTMDELNDIIEHCYATPVMEAKEFCNIVDRFEELRAGSTSEHRTTELASIIKAVYADGTKYHELILETLIKPIGKFVGLDRCMVEARRAEFRFNKNKQRFVMELINQVDSEFVGTLSFSRDVLFNYGLNRVMFEDEQPKPVEIEEIEEVDCDLLKTDDIDSIISFVTERGFTKVRQSGSHAIYKHNNGKIVVIPIHNTIDVHLGIAIQKQALQRA